MAGALADVIALDRHPFFCRAVDMVGEFSDLTITALHSRLKRHHLPEAEKAEASADAG